MWSGAWNKRKLTSEISNRFLPSSVGRNMRLMIQRLWVQTPLGRFLMKLILCCVISDLSDNLTEIRQISLSWKTWLSLSRVFASWLQKFLEIWRKMRPVSSKENFIQSQVIILPVTQNHTTVITDVLCVVSLNFYFIWQVICNRLVWNIQYFQKWIAKDIYDVITCVWFLCMIIWYITCVFIMIGDSKNHFEQDSGGHFVVLLQDGLSAKSILQASHDLYSLCLWGHQIRTEPFRLEWSTTKKGKNVWGENQMLKHETKACFLRVWFES